MELNTIYGYDVLILIDLLCIFNDKRNDFLSALQLFISIHYFPLKNILLWIKNSISEMHLPNEQSQSKCAIHLFFKSRLLNERKKKFLFPLTIVYGMNLFRFD